MITSRLLVAVVAALVGGAVTPWAHRLIASVPPDPDDDPPPVPRVGPYLARGPRLGLLLAAVSATVGFAGGAEWATPAHVVTAVGLTVLSVIDLDLFLLPKRIVWPLTAAVAGLLAAAAVAQSDAEPLTRALVCAAGAFGAFLVLNLVNPRGMGFGDVRLSALIGLALGWIGVTQAMLGLFAGFLFGAVVGLGLIAFGGRSRQDAVPFGPFMALGALFVLVGGDTLVGFARV